MSKEDGGDDGEINYWPNMEIIPNPLYGPVNLQVREKWVPILDSGGNVIIGGHSVVGGESYVSGTVLKYHGAIAVDWASRWEETDRHEFISDCPYCGKSQEWIRTFETLGDRSRMIVEMPCDCLAKRAAVREETKGPRLKCVGGNPKAPRSRRKGKMKIAR